MNNYISKRKGEKTPFFRNLSGRLSKVRSKLSRDSSVLENLNEHEVHVEHKKPGILARIFSILSRKEQEEVAEEIKSEPEEEKEEMAEIAEEYETLSEVEEEIEEKKVGLLARFLKFFMPDSNEEDVSAEEVAEAIENQRPADERIDEMQEEIKSLSKITFSVISQLTKAKQKNFKESEDFAEYKQILEKHGLVK